MTPRTRAVARTMTGTAGVIAALLVVALPVAYFAVSYQYVVGSLDTRAQVKAHAVAQMVAANPRLWTYEQVRLAELLERRTGADIPEARRVLEPSGRVVAEAGDPLAPPLVARRHPVHDTARVVALVEVSRSLRPLLLETAAALAAALLVAALVFWVIRVVPLRAVEHAYRSLEESERRYRSLYESMGEGMALHRVLRDPGGRAVSLQVVDANPAFCRMLGAQAAGAATASLAGGVLAPFLPQMLGAAQGGERAQFELTTPGTARALRVSASCPEPGHCATLVEDVTERKQAEALRLRERLNQAQKLEAVGCLAGGVAHDFNNILTVILSFAGELAEEVDGDRRQGALEIQRAAQRAAALTRQLLSFSRKQVLRPEVLDVREVLAGTVRMIGRLIGERIAVSLDAPDDVGCVLMDPSQLEQVLVNLAVNARDAMPDGGRLTLAASGATVEPGVGGGAFGLPPGRYVVLRVSDTGIGMDEATRSRIFEPFFTTKPRGKGTGLGLAMVFGAVEQSGGRIDVESRPGAGTTFTIHLPRAEARAPRRAEATAAPPAGRGERILLVEDEPQVRSAIRGFLAAGGYRVVEAANGDDGLDAFRTEQGAFDLVLTDLVMPGMGGLALGRAVREHRPVPVLFMTGYSDDVASGQEGIPADQLLQKPFDGSTLLARVRGVLAGPVAAPGP